MKTFDEVYENMPGNGWLTKEEAELLWKTMSAVSGNILEVGCFEGRSTVLLASTGNMVLAVDPFAGFNTEDPTGERTAGRFLDNIKSRGLHNVCHYGVRVEEFGGVSAEAAFLDGDHSRVGTKAQIEAALTAGAKTIAIHDVEDSGDGAVVRDVAVQMLGPWQEKAGRLAVWRI